MTMKKKPSAAQLAARKKFAAMAKARAGKKKKPTAKAKRKAPKRKASKLVKSSAAKRKTTPRSRSTWLCVYVLVGGVKYFDTGTNRLDTSKAKAERYATKELATAAGRNVARRIRVAHDGVYAERCTAPK